MIVGEQNKNNFYNLKDEKEENVDEGPDKLQFSFLCCGGLLLSGGTW